MSNVTTATSAIVSASMDDFQVVDYLSKAQNSYYDLLETVNYQDAALKIALFFVAFNPIYWNIVARLEYSTHFLTKIAGSANRGCYVLALSIFCLGIARDYFFEQALRSQEASNFLDCDHVRNVGYVAFCIGQVFVLSSMYQLGITGTYLGDYFGILMNERVVSFPFNVSDNPMYQGSTLSFLGTSLIYGKPAGLVVTVAVYLVYNIALRFEEPFTGMIYSLRDKKNAKKAN